MDVDALLSWYERVKRPLPWRATRDPYALLVSEVMLQQTQALRVVPYYERWLERFPDASSLAAAPARDVLAHWSGLGYNRRALALQRAAAHVSENGWPSDLTQLDGVGPYTAAAVSSFAFDRDIAAVDTNVRRVLTRRDGVIHSPRELARRAGELLPRGRAAVVQPGDDGARRDRLPAARATLRRLPRGERLRRPERRSRAEASRGALRGQRPLGARPHRGGAARRHRAAGQRRAAASARWPGSSATV